MNTILQLNNVSFAYKKKTVFSDFNMTVEKGDVFAVLGHNGAGKTTLLKLIAGLLKCKGGNVIRNYDYTKIGFMNDALGLYPYLSGLENLKMILYRNKLSLSNEEIEKLLKTYQITDKKNEIVDHYSTGMKKKLSLLGVLLSKPDLLLLDEPFSGIDPVSLDFMIKKIKETVTENNACLLVNHDLNSTKQLCNKFLIIKNGEITFYSDKAQDIENLDELYLKYSENPLCV